MSGDTRKAPKQVGKVLAKAATGIVNVGVAGASAVGAVALHSWPILALGGVAYAALVAWDMVTPEFWKKALGSGAGPTKLPRPADLHDPATQKAVASILAARDELANVLTSTPADVAKHLTVVLGTLDELERRTASLVARAEHMAAYMKTVNAEPIREEAERLRDKAARARDREAKSQYESARSAREEQLKAIAEIEDARDRLHANLARIVATFEGMPAQVVRMRVLDDQAMDALTGDMSQKLERVNNEIRYFEDGLKNLVEITKA